MAACVEHAHASCFTHQWTGGQREAEARANPRNKKQTKRNKSKQDNTKRQNAKQSRNRNNQTETAQKQKPIKAERTNEHATNPAGKQPRA